MPPDFLMRLENLVANISLAFTHNVTKTALCKSCLFRDDCDLKNVSKFLFVMKNREGVQIKNEIGRDWLHCRNSIQHILQNTFQ